MIYPVARHELSGRDDAARPDHLKVRAGHAPGSRFSLVRQKSHEVIAVVDVAGRCDVPLHFRCEGAVDVARRRSAGSASSGRTAADASTSSTASGLVLATKRGRNSAKLSKAACLVCLNRTGLSTRTASAQCREVPQRSWLPGAANHRRKAPKSVAHPIRSLRGRQLPHPGVGTSAAGCGRGPDCAWRPHTQRQGAPIQAPVPDADCARGRRDARCPAYGKQRVPRRELRPRRSSCRMCLFRGPIGLVPAPLGRESWRQGEAAAKGRARPLAASERMSPPASIERAIQVGSQRGLRGP